MTTAPPPTEQSQAPPTNLTAHVPPAAPAPTPTPATVTSDWSTTADPDTDTPARRTARWGLPVGPTIVTAGNSAGLTLTAAYQVGGPLAAATTGALVVVGATASVIRRRATVRRTKASRSGSGPRGGAGSGPRGSGGTKPRSGSGSGVRPVSGATKRGGSSGLGLLSGRSATGGKRSGLGSGSGGRSGSGTGGGGGRGAHRGGRSGTGLTSGWTGGGKSATVAAAVHRAKRKKRKKSAASKMLAATGRFAGRTMKRGWRSEAARKTRAAVLQGVRKSAAAVGRGIKKTPRAIFDAILAAGAGVLSGLWHVSASAALRRLRDVWNRRRARAAERRARAAERRAAKKTAQDGTAPVPAAPATFVRRPAHAGTGPSTLNGGTNMPGGGHHFVAPAMESLRIAGAYNPQGMAEVGADFAGLAEALELEAEAIRITVENANANWPLNQGIVDILAQVHNLKIKAAELAKELPVAFENLHDVDLARLRNPRKGAAEAMWDYSRNPGA